jgi:hypothetical protein
MRLESMMKQVTIIVAVALFTAALIGQYAPLRAQDSEMPDEEIKRLNAAVEMHERYLGQLYDLISDLDYAAEESSNANRRVAINGIHALMVKVILQMEDEISKTRVIQTHGKVQDSDERKAKKAGHTLPGSKNQFQYEAVTGQAKAGNYWIHRLAHMQSVYRVCSTSREPAISKHQNGLPFFMDKSAEFARLMEGNISDVQRMLPASEQDEKEDKGKYQARESKYE